MYLNKLVSYVTGYTQNKILYYMDRKKFALSDVNNVVNYGWCKKEIKYAWSRFYYLSSKWNAFWHREEKSTGNWNWFCCLPSAFIARSQGPNLIGWLTGFFLLWGIWWLEYTTNVQLVIFLTVCVAFTYAS